VENAVFLGLFWQAKPAKITPKPFIPRSPSRLPHLIHKSGLILDWQKSHLLLHNFNTCIDPPVLCRGGGLIAIITLGGCLTAVYERRKTGDGSSIRGSVNGCT
jgi:hypothetical protein